MTTNNAVNTGLSGASGTVHFAGTDSPTFTTLVNTPNLQFTANTITATNSNGGITFTVNGSGLYILAGTSTQGGTLAFAENSGNGINYIGLKSPETVSNSIIFTLPDADGTNGQVLATNGSKILNFITASGLGGGSGPNTTHNYTTGTTWNKTANLDQIFVLCLGGGAAGGSSTGGLGFNGAGGGGAGSYGWAYIPAASLSSTETVTIGAGGTPGGSGNHPGGNGGTTSFGSHISAGGGTGGPAGILSTQVTGGAGGICTGGDINIPGDAGWPGGLSSTTNFNGNSGGYSPYGAPGKQLIAESDGNSATGYGAGGGGAYSQTNSKNGGAGAPGFCIVYEYITIASGRLLDINNYTISGTWTKPADLSNSLVICLAGGGAGGGAANLSSGVSAGGGGGAGGYGWAYIAAGSLGATETVTVGAGGTAGTAGNHPGNDGGTTSFGSHITALGGTGGTGMPNQSQFYVTGGAGGTCSGGDINITGQTGLNGWTILGQITYQGLSGSGGDSIWGSGGAGIATSGGVGAAASSGNAGNGYGAGGSGASILDTNTNKAGGAGSPGICIVYDYS